MVTGFSPSHEGRAGSGVGLEAGLGVQGGSRDWRADVKGGEEQEVKEEEEDKDFMTGSELQVIGSKLHTRPCQIKHRQLCRTVSHMPLHYGVI